MLSMSESIVLRKVCTYLTLKNIHFSIIILMERCLLLNKHSVEIVFKKRGAYVTLRVFLSTNCVSYVKEKNYIFELRGHQVSYDNVKKFNSYTDCRKILQYHWNFKPYQIYSVGVLGVFQ